MSGHAYEAPERQPPGPPGAFPHVKLKDAAPLASEPVAHLVQGVR